MSMEKFSPEFDDPVHYILDITYRIWEERGVHRILDWYAADCPTRTPHGVIEAARDVVTATIQTMHEWPDREVLGEDVIIGEKTNGFYSSHRARSTATHVGDGQFGKATGKSVVMLAIADCLCCENQIVEEWLVRDQARIIQQLGMEPKAFGQELGMDNPEKYAIGNAAMRQRWADENGLTIEGDQTIADTLLKLQNAIWNDCNHNVIESGYDRAVRFEGPEGILCYGRRQLSDQYTALIASIPDGNFEPHHVIVQQNSDDRIRIALRWSYCGTHSGRGCYGDPTGIPLAILGISHFELRNGKILGEYMLIDNLSIYAQLGASLHHLDKYEF